MLGGKIDRIRNDSVFGTLYLIYLVSLLLNRHILVDNAYTALPRHSDSHSMLRNRIHSGAHHRNIQPDGTRQVR